jgi:hypothetical protein
MDENDLRRGREPEPTLAELVESAMRKLVTAVVIGAGLIGLAIWSRPGPARYQGFAADGRVFRINTDSGTIIACEGTRCAIVLAHGHSLEDSLPAPAAPKQLAPAPPPAPAAAPAPAPAPAPATH